MPLILQIQPISPLLDGEDGESSGLEGQGPDPSSWLLMSGDTALGELPWLSDSDVDHVAFPPGIDPAAPHALTLGRPLSPTGWRSALGEIVWPRDVDPMAWQPGTQRADGSIAPYEFSPALDGYLREIGMAPSEEALGDILNRGDAAFGSPEERIALHRAAEARSARLSDGVVPGFSLGEPNAMPPQALLGATDGLFWLPTSPGIPLLEPDAALPWLADAEPRPFTMYDFDTVRAYNAYREGLPGGIRPPTPAAPPDSGDAPYEDGDWLDRRWQDVEAAAELGYNAVTGDDRREFDYPSATYLPVDDFWQRLGWSTAQMVTMTDTGLADIIHARYPDALWGEDRFGNTIVVVDDQPYYLNRPGIDAVDITRYGPSSLLQGVAARYGMNWGGVTPPEIVARTSGAAMGAISARGALDEVSRWFGSDVPVGYEQENYAQDFLKNLGKLAWKIFPKL